MIYDKASVIFFRPIKDNYMKWKVFPAIPFVSINECQAKHVYAIAKDAGALEICKLVHSPYFIIDQPAQLE
jgi:hypothetical protein